MILLLWVTTHTMGPLMHLVGDDESTSGVLLMIVALACPLLLLIVGVHGDRHHGHDAC